jgi:ribosome-binding factor A
MKRRASSQQNSKPPGQRQLRVGEHIRHTLVEIMRDGKFRDPDLSQPHLITVTAVEVGPDLSHAHVFVIPLGGKDAEKIIAALNRAAGYLRTELAARMDMRYTPKVSFKYDRSFDESAHIDRLLRQDKTSHNPEE